MFGYTYDTYSCRAETMSISVGIEVWLQHANRRLRIGLLSHQAALISTGETSAQALRRIFGDHFVALFGPEHGFFGQMGAGEKAPTSIHPSWGIPVYSLYGNVRKPTPEMLAGLDLLVVDLQDIGVRCYTYLATLIGALEACAEANVDCLVCDRPIPFPGIEDGPVAEPEHFSFVAPCALPFVHGKTHTQVADWLGLPHLSSPMVGDATTVFGERPQGIPEFVPPSPAIRSWETARSYPALVFAEALPQLNVARTSAYAFRVLAAPWFNGIDLADRLNAVAVPGVRFFDFTQTSAYGAIRLHITTPAVYRPWRVTCALLNTLQETYGAERLFNHPQAKPEWMTKLYGTTLWQDVLGKS